MVRRKWVGDPTCRFCEAAGTADHLFFQCPTAKVVWGIVAVSLGVTNIPNNISQFWNWIARHLPNINQIHSFGLAAICWAIWKARNKGCFEAKIIKHPVEIICHACSLMLYWTGLHKADFQAQLMEGVNTLLSMACRMLASQRSQPSSLRLLPADEDGEQDEEDN